MGLGWLDSGTAGLVLGISLGMLIAGALVAPILIVRMPADYFVRHSEGERESKASIARTVMRVLKNALGLLLVLAGVAMLVLPGQGILTLLIGISLLNFPGKRRFQQRLLRIHAVERVVQAIRHRAGRPPLELEQHHPNAHP
jgi:hypothetical protein